MTTLDDIRQAKEIGNSIRKIREAQNLSLRDFATIAGLSINQVTSLESGNHFAFHQNLDEFYRSAMHCLTTFGVDNVSLHKEMPVFLNHKELEASIPTFLQKSA
jgi:transcriptional regulator with XRE-family HTH domain